MFVFSNNTRMTGHHQPTTPLPTTQIFSPLPSHKERNWQRVALATQCAKEVLPQPGGPQRIKDGKRSSCTSKNMQDFDVTKMDVENGC